MKRNSPEQMSFKFDETEEETSIGMGDKTESKFEGLLESITVENLKRAIQESGLPVQEKKEGKLVAIREVNGRYRFARWVKPSAKFIKTTGIDISLTLEPVDQRYCERILKGEALPTTMATKSTTPLMELKGDDYEEEDDDIYRGPSDVWDPEKRTYV